MSKTKKKKAKSPQKERRFGDVLLDNKPGMILLGLLSILAGLFLSLPQLAHRPVTYQETKPYVVRVESVDVGRNWLTLYGLEGESYEFYSHVMDADQCDYLADLPYGAMVHLRVHPDSGYVLECQAAGRTLFEFEAMQEAIVSYSYGYVGIGVFAVLAGAFLIGFPFLFSRAKDRETGRQNARDAKRGKGKGSGALRRAGNGQKGRTLLTASTKGYDICYRRVGFTNELVINGLVYDEVKGVLEFDHALKAVVQGNVIEAGLKDQESYITFNGQTCAAKTRHI